MQKLAKSALLIVASFGLGAIFGPVVIAGITALRDDTVYMHQSSEALKLVKAYQAKLPPLVLFLSLPDPDEGKACGYEPNKLFPQGIGEMAEARSLRRFSDYEGYYALENWASDLKDKAFIAEIVEKIDRNMDRRSIVFLRRCIESTIFAETCMGKVEDFGDSVNRFPNKQRQGYWPASGHEQEVICAYLDAIAARRGLSVPKRED